MGPLARCLNPHNRVERMLIYRIDPAIECGTR